MTENGKATLIGQLADTLRSAIRRGELAPGSKLPGERQLAERYGVCRVTVVAALARLAEEKLIEKIPLRGSFVLDHALPPRIILAYPEAELGASDSPENRFAFFEFHRGLLAAAAPHGIQIVTGCFPRERLEEHLDEYLDRLGDFDAVIFPSEQLAELREKLFGKKTVIVRTGPHLNPAENPFVIRVAYDHAKAFDTLLERVRELRWRDCAAITPVCSDWFRTRAKIFAERSRAMGMNCIDLVCSPETFADALKQCHGRFVFLNNTHCLGNFYRACDALKLVPGRDFALAGLCSGGTLANLEPAPAYLKVPHFEEGIAAFNLAWNRATPQICNVPVSLIENQTLMERALS